MLFIHEHGRLAHSLGRGVVAEDTADLMLAQVVVIDPGLLEGLTRRHIGILRLLRHTGTGMAVQHLFGDDRRLHLSCQTGAITIGESFLLEHDT